MDRKTASKLIEENLHTIFAWSLSKLYDKSEAEDLTQDIIYAVLRSVSRLENDEAFYGFMWRIAENTFRSKIRKKRLDQESYEDHKGVYLITPEDNYIEAEQLQFLRRELALLSEQYREVTVKYYIYGKSCSEISAELNVSTEMVKYYLFKTRKILKEGIGMTREFGERSYDPGIFRMDFWGGSSEGYWEIFERRLPGNILLSAYDKPVTVTELSVELGVAAAYLEDEIKILEQHDIIKKIGDKYQTNIIIFTRDYDRYSLEKFRPVYKKAASEFDRKLDEILPQLRSFEFYGSDLDENCLKWTFANIAMYHALMKSDEDVKEKFGDYPPLSNGSYGFVFGYDNDYENHHFNGIYGCMYNAKHTALVSVENYKIIEKCQFFKPGNMARSASALSDAVMFKNADENNDQLTRLISEGFISSDNGKLSPNFPVFGGNIFYGEMKKLLEPVVNEAYNCMKNICEIAAECLKDHAPKALKNRCAQLAFIRHQMDSMAYIIEEMADRGQLIVPDKKVNLCMFGVDLTK